MNKTEYRIITHQTFIADRYLQFKSTKKTLFGKIKDVWRFIPEESVGRVLGYYLHPEDCPIKIPYGHEGWLLHCFHDQENYSIGGVIPFTKEYPDINKYFEYLRSERKKHIKEYKEKCTKEGKVTLL
jgi:hypothetical protein